MFKFSIASAFRRKFVSFLAILGVGLGAGLLVALLSMSQGIENRFTQSFQNVSGTISVTSEGGNVFGRILGTPGEPLPVSYTEDIRKIAGVELASPFVSASVRSQKFGALASIGIGITGVVAGDELFDSPNQKITEGRPFEAENEVIVGARVYAGSHLSDIDLKVGDSFSAPVGNTGEFEEITIVGVYDTGDQVNDHGLFGPVALVRRLGQIPNDKVNGFLVRVADPTAVNEVAKSIEVYFANQDPALSASVAADLFESFSSLLDSLNLFLLAIALVAAAAGGTAVMVVMLLTVFERKKEFGILKAAGWSAGNILISVLLTSLAISGLGVVLGMLMGVGAALGLRSALGMEVVAFTLETFLWAAGVGLVTGLIGGILPAVTAVRVSPIETLHGE